MAGPLLPDDLWNLIRPLLPQRPPRLRGGRPPVRDRDALTGILFVLKTGLQWQDLPGEMGCGSGMTCLRRLREWQEGGVWQQVEELLMHHLREADRVDWSRAWVRVEPETHRVPASAAPAIQGRLKLVEQRYLNGRIDEDVQV